MSRVLLFLAPSYLSRNSLREGGQAGALTLCETLPWEFCSNKFDSLEGLQLRKEIPARQFVLLSPDGNSQSDWLFQLWIFSISSKMKESTLVEDLHLFFAGGLLFCHALSVANAKIASGDMRNGVKSLTGLSATYTGHCA